MRRGQASCGAACAGPLPEVAAGGVSEDVPFPLGEEGKKRATEGHGVPRCPREGGSQPTRGARGRPRLRTGARQMQRGCGTHSSVASTGLRPRGGQGGLGGVNS